VYEIGIGLRQDLNKKVGDIPEKEKDFLSGTICFFKFLEGF